MFHVISPPDAQGIVSSIVERDSGGIVSPTTIARGDTELLRVVAGRHDFTQYTCPEKMLEKTGNCEKVYFAERNVILQQRAEGSWVAVKPSRFDVLGIVS